MARSSVVAAAPPLQILASDPERELSKLTSAARGHLYPLFEICDSVIYVLPGRNTFKECRGTRSDGVKYHSYYSVDLT